MDGRYGISEGLRQGLCILKGTHHLGRWCCALFSVKSKHGVAEAWRGILNRCREGDSQKIRQVVMTLPSYRHHPVSHWCRWLFACSHPQISRVNQNLSRFENQQMLKINSIPVILSFKFFHTCFSFNGFQQCHMAVFLVNDLQWKQMSCLILFHSLL